jgi:glycosyltransferase involved in cell wall biosynthesis
MKILIDLQGCQTASRHRGIGRYSLALAKAIVRNRGEHRVILLANGAFAEGQAELRSHFFGQIPDHDFIVFDAEFPVAEFDTANTARARFAEIARERLISNIAPDAVLLTSLFEGFVDDAVTSIGWLGTKPLTVVTLYDLIPYLNPDPNWPSHYKPYYDRKIESLKQADLLLSISDYARKEAGAALPELAARIVNMSSACDPIFSPGNVDIRRSTDLFPRFGITRAFLMSAGTLEPRKNFDQLLRAFAILPEDIRRHRQVVLVGAGDDGMVDSLRQLASGLGFDQGQLVITGQVSDDDLLDLYRLCELFVFPSKHEGFGLPPLEAMSCGAAVIGSSATSVTEVIGRQDALFDPASDEALHDLMLKALTDECFRTSLKVDGLTRAREFSWDRTATTAIRAISDALGSRTAPATMAAPAAHVKRPCLAMISPLPPEQTGIATYLADLLPELSSVYDITMISDQPKFFPGPQGRRFHVESIAWFEEHASEFTRIVYHVGNSPFHAHMIDLLARHPGVVVLHDFFISSLKLWMEATGYRASSFKASLCHSHGYGALVQLGSEGEQSAKFNWPCSFSVVNNALGLIVHSRYSRDLVAKYYGASFIDKVAVVRQHRSPVGNIDRQAARFRLGIAESEFLVCAFGFIDTTKLNHALIEAWGRSSLSGETNSRLVFVGGKGEPAYARRIDEAIAAIENGKLIAITGFAPDDLFADYLAAADTAVQLRTMTRGETSRTVLDCLAYGVPLIINAHGPMDEYPNDCLIKLPDDFDVSELTNALEKMRANTTLRQRLSANGIACIKAIHAPAATVQGYVEVIERVATSPASQATSRTVSRFWESIPLQPLTEQYETARKLADQLIEPRRPVIYLNVSAISMNDLKTGIERVARSLMREMLLAPPEGYIVVPVYLAQENDRWRVRKAHQYLAKQPGFSLVPPEDELVFPAKGDFLMALDLFPDGVNVAEKQGLYAYWHAAGARIGFMVFDLLPISHPQFFPPWAPAGHETWMKSVCSVADLVVCISAHVESELHRWLDRQEVATSDWPEIVVCHLGADVEASLPTRGLPEDIERVLDILASRPTFLMVGTIEPRKGHLQALHAFAELWNKGVNANLVIVGYEGWKSLPNEDRRTIPEIVDTIRNSSEVGKRLFWLEGISDEYLEKVYALATCLIAASQDEGFGLPLIEAARRGLPVLARDIPVFREVAGDSVEYFSADTSSGLADTVSHWLESKVNRGTRPANGKPWITWRQSAERLSDLIIKAVARGR